MTRINKLYSAPEPIFDWYIEADQEGYIPSYDDLVDEFGKENEEWANILGLPDARLELGNEVDDEEFTTEDAMKYSGHKQSDFE